MDHFSEQEVQTPNEPLYLKARVILEQATHIGEMMDKMKMHVRFCAQCRMVKDRKDARFEQKWRAA